MPKSTLSRSFIAPSLVVALVLTACAPEAKSTSEAKGAPESMSVAKVDKTHAEPAGAAAAGTGKADAAGVATASAVGADGTAGSRSGEDGAAVRGKPIEARGVYATATTVELPRFKSMIAELKASGGNMIVFDAKDETGTVQYKSEVPLAKQIGAFKEGPIKDLKAKVAYAHSQGVRMAGRICCFQDPILAAKRGDLAPRNVNGGTWKELGRQIWLDPSKAEAQAYLIDLAKELAAFGVDEVQFDYIRFPAMGRTQDARYAFDAKALEKHDVITGFLKQAYQAVKTTAPEAVVSIDVYGIMAWAQPIDIRITGQKMEDMAKYTDVICPMVYPSHFNDGFAGIPRPANQPYMFVDKGLSLLNKRVAGTGVTVRPWLQAMPYKVANFTPRYITEQLKASTKNHAVGYMMWNAQNKYDTAWAGMKAYHKL